MAEAPIGVVINIPMSGYVLTKNSPGWRDWVPQSGICGPGKQST